MEFGVRNLINDRGNYVANQFVIKTTNGTYFQSYNSVVAKVDNKGNLFLSQDWDYSNTTRKHLYIFLRNYGFHDYCTAKDMRKAIKDGEVILKNVDSLDVD